MRGMNRDLLKMYPLARRDNLLSISDIAVSPESTPYSVTKQEEAQISRLADRIIAAHRSGSSVILTYGAHLVKNGLGPVVARMIRDGWITHVATNGAGSIHDWEFAHIGMSSESVRDNVARGMFGTWEETGLFINTAITMGVIDGLGYGWSIGKMIADDGIVVPSKDSLRERIAEVLASDAPGDELGALSDALSTIYRYELRQGRIEIEHPFKDYSIQYVAWKEGTPFTVHPGIGYDIIYTHPANCGGAIGRGAVRDFLSYADSVAGLGGGVHISIGSAIMAPMIFEKSLSMANNLSIRKTGQPISNHYLAVVDIQDGGGWDWSQGEPPKDNPAYYLRFCKSFNRMGGTLDYICMDNRHFMVNLYNELNAKRQ